MDFQVGSLVRTRQRDWVVQPSDDTDVLLLKPLGGTDDETTGLFLGLPGIRQTIKSAEFTLPTADNLGAFDTARLLFEATRLSFRSGAGPFRSLARLSFRPRSYQIVPLIMALRLDPVRLLIADDVGVGKTAESLLIVKELLERREIKRFAVVCPPHLCDQWQRELKDKFGIDAVIIRSDTQARLDRDIQGDVSVYTYYPYQIISIDYIKTDARRQVFINEGPELCIVDEVHTCANPDGQSSSGSQQQRYALLRDLAAKEGQHLILLTATPHSGKPAEFQSLLGLLKPEFAKTDLLQMDPDARKRLARHFVQRKRGDVIQWLGEDTPFPKRDGGEFHYELSPDYAAFYDNLLDFAQQLIRPAESGKGSFQARYWSALALLRGAMSSPKAGIEMLNRKLGTDSVAPEVDADEVIGDNPVMDTDAGQETDVTPGQVLEKSRWTSSEVRTIRSLLSQLEELQSIRKDYKAGYTASIVEEWLGQGFQPVIFCRYIATAKYVGELLKPALQKKWANVDVQIVTSEDPDEVRRQRIDDMAKSAKRVLVCTDCLSEGINLQDSFSAVLHYDLPWNPNRLEQREGRVDRFGQLAKTVKTYLLYGKDNPIDGVVLRVIINKVREIRKTIGISMPFPDDSRSIADAVLQAVLINPKKVRAKLQAQTQLSLDFGSDEQTAIIGSKELEVSKAVEAAAAREEKSRSLFAQHAIKAHEIEDDLRETDEAIGNPAAVEAFVKLAVHRLGGQIDSYQKGYKLYTHNLPVSVLTALPSGKGELLVSFHSPVPEGYIYIGRNHAFVENLCQYIIVAAMEATGQIKIARASVIRTRNVDVKTTVLVFRVRNVIRERGGQTDLVAEEMLVWGYRGSPEDADFLDPEKGEGRALIDSAQPSAEMTGPQKAMFLEDELENLTYLKEAFDKVAYERAEKLVTAHDRVRQVIGASTAGAKKYQVVTPVLPMDVLGIYVLVPGK